MNNNSSKNVSKPVQTCFKINFMPGEKTASTKYVLSTKKVTSVRFYNLTELIHDESDFLWFSLRDRSYPQSSALTVTRQLVIFSTYSSR